MSSPVDPDEPVITNATDLSDALQRHFLANADAGDNATNDDLVAQLVAWRRQQVGRDDQP
ncbi:MAG: hypothetical protein ACRDQA_26595 [Nocardioidaceae bacterium]